MQKTHVARQVLADRLAKATSSDPHYWLDILEDIEDFPADVMAWAYEVLDGAGSNS